MPLATYPGPAWARHRTPIRSCSRRGLPCRRCCQPRGALLPHHFTLTPPEKIRRGGVFSVALSVGSRRPGITRRLRPVEPGLSSPRERGATVWPTPMPSILRARRNCKRREKFLRRSLPRQSANSRKNFRAVCIVDDAGGQARGIFHAQQKPRQQNSVRDGDDTVAVHIQFAGSYAGQNVCNNDRIIRFAKNAAGQTVFNAPSA